MTRVAATTRPRTTSQHFPSLAAALSVSQMVTWSGSCPFPRIPGIALILKIFSFCSCLVIKKQQCLLSWHSYSSMPNDCLEAISYYFLKLKCFEFPKMLSFNFVLRLLDEEIKHEMNKVIIRAKRPSRPKSEVFLDQDDRYTHTTSKFSRYKGTRWIN